MFENRAELPGGEEALYFLESLGGCIVRLLARSLPVPADDGVVVRTRNRQELATIKRGRLFLPQSSGSNASSIDFELNERERDTTANCCKQQCCRLSAGQIPSFQFIRFQKQVTVLWPVNVSLSLAKP